VTATKSKQKSSTTENFKNFHQHNSSNTPKSVFAPTIMAPAATTNELTPASAIQESINNSKASLDDAPHPAYLRHLATQILHNLQYQHSWTALTIHTHSPLTSLPLARPLISGLPPKRVYIHPDEQAAVIKVEHDTGKKIEQTPEREWVLPTHIIEKWTLSGFAQVFGALSVVPPGENGTDDVDDDDDDKQSVGHQWQGENRQKRLLLATLDEDSTVTYYIMHDGIVKPRQN
jgi:tRNA-splicing endonuclease subunit Sen15